MNAGDLDQRVTLQQRSASGSPPQNEYGEPEQTWEDVASIWAAVEPLRGRELFQVQQRQSEVTTRIRIRYRAGVTSAMRIVHGSTIYDIADAIDPRSRHEELELMCTTGVGGG